MATGGVAINMAALMQELYEATEQYEQAKRAEDAASSDRVRAINRPNGAQQAMDKAVAELRKLAPRDSDWNRPRAVPCDPSPQVQA